MRSYNVGRGVSIIPGHLLLKNHYISLNLQFPQLTFKEPQRIWALSLNWDSPNPKSGLGESGLGDSQVKGLREKETKNYEKLELMIKLPNQSTLAP